MKELLPALLLSGLSCFGFLGCSRDDPSAALHAYWLSRAPALPVAAQPAAETPPEATSADAELDAFQERLRQSCHVAPEPITTAEMVAASNALEQCAEQRIRSRLERLPPARRAALLAATQPARFAVAAGSWYPAWTAWRTATCLLQDALEHGGYARGAGTLRAITRASCRAVSTQYALYWLESLEAGDTAAFARHVRARAVLGRRDEVPQLELTRLLRALEAGSPETALEDDYCPICRLGDADFRRLLRAQEAAQTTARALAEATCHAWPELEAELGGGDGCRRQLRWSWLAEAINPDASLESASWTAPESPDQGSAFPPPKDRDYAAFVQPLYAACERESTTPKPEAKSACLKRAARASLPPLPAAQRRTLSGLDAAWQPFARELCRVDARLLPGSGLPLAAYGEPECRLLQTARGEYLLAAWAGRHVNQLHRHLLARRSWATRSNAALAQLAPSPPLLRARHDFARALCVAWPGLDDTTETCVELLELHLLSYGQHLGALSSAPAPAAAP